MKLNWSFLSSSALTITLLTSATISAQGFEVTNSAQNQSGESHGELTAALAAKSEGSDQSALDSDQKFSSKNIAQMEFALAILVLIVGLVASARYQSNQEQQPTAQGEFQENTSVNGSDQEQRPGFTES